MSNIDIKTLEIKKEAEQWKKGGRTLYNKAEAIEPISNGHDNGLNSNDKTDSDKENFNSIKYKGEEYPIYIPEDKGPTLQSAENGRMYMKIR